MALNYFIGMGGSGEKAAEALIYSVAAGAVTNGEKVSVAMIDQDTNCGNYQRFEKAHRDYVDFKEVMEKDGTHRLTENNYDNTWKLQNAVDMVADGHATNLKTTFGVRDGSDEQYLLDCMFTAGEQIFKTDKGYYGHPTFGSLIVKAAMTTQSFEDSPLVTDIRAAINDGENINIFLVGSNFGGTGAATFPNVAKKLREIINNSSKQAAENAKICGALLLPYFTVPSAKGTHDDVDLNHFFMKSAVSLENYSKDTVGGYDVVYGPNAAAGNPYIYDRIVLIGAPKAQSTIKDDHPGTTPALGGADQTHYLSLPDFVAALSACSFFSKPDDFCQRNVQATKDTLNYVVVKTTPGNGGAPGTVNWNDIPGVNINEKFEKFTRFALITTGYLAPKIQGENTNTYRKACEVYKKVFAAKMPFKYDISERSGALLEDKIIKNQKADLTKVENFLFDFLSAIFYLQEKYTDSADPAAKLFEYDTKSALNQVVRAYENGKTNEKTVYVDPDVLKDNVSKILLDQVTSDKAGSTIINNAILNAGIDYTNGVAADKRVSEMLIKTFNEC